LWCGQYGAVLVDRRLIGSSWPMRVAPTFVALLVKVVPQIVLLVAPGIALAIAFNSAPQLLLQLHPSPD